MKYFRILFFFTFLQILIVKPSVYAQSSGSALLPDSLRTSTFDQLADRIEKNYQVKICFRPEWFKNKVFPLYISSLPLEQGIEQIKQLADIDCIPFSDKIYVFVPRVLKNFTNKKDSKGVLLIGERNIPSSREEVKLMGKIINSKTGKPLAGAKLIIDDLHLNSVSDNNGNYKLSLPTGEYVVRLAYPGMKDDIQSIRISDSGVVDFEKTEGTILLKEVMVTEKSSVLLKPQMSLIRITKSAIKELPLTLGEKDVLKSIAMFPGVQTTGEFGTGLFVRGGGSDQNLILIEDEPLFNSSHVFGLSSVVNADGVSNISFIKSGMPAKYGERASSVMDIRLSNNFDNFSLKGGIGLLDSRLNAEIPLFNKKVQWLIGGRTSYSDWLLHAMPDAELKQSSAGFYDLNTLLNIKLNHSSSLALFGYVSNDRFSFTPINSYRYKNTLFSARYIHNFDSGISLNAVAGMSRYYMYQSENDTLKPLNAYKFNSSISYYNAKTTLSWIPNSNHSVEGGLNFVMYDIQPGELSPDNPQSTITHRKLDSENGFEISGFLSDSWTISPKLSADIGLRYTAFAYLGPGSILIFKENAARTKENIVDSKDYSSGKIINWYSGLEPRFSVRYLLNDQNSIKASYNRNKQYINMVSNTNVMSPADIYKLSDPNINPVICNQVAVGYYHTFNKNTAEASLEFYYKKLNNVVEYRNGGSIFMNELIDADLLKASSNNYGAEVYLKKNTGRLTGWISYTYSRSIRKTSSVYADDQINGNRNFSSPYDKPHNLVVQGMYHLTRRWWVSGTFTYRTGQPVTLPEYKYTFQGNQYVYYSDRNEYRLSDYHRLDIAITHEETLKLKQRWKGSWTLAIINVYGQKNPYSAYYKSSTGYSQTYNLYELFIIARPIPVLTYNVTF